MSRMSFRIARITGYAILELKVMLNGQVSAEPRAILCFTARFRLSIQEGVKNIALRETHLLFGIVKLIENIALHTEILIGRSISE